MLSVLRGGRGRIYLALPAARRAASWIERIFILRTTAYMGTLPGKDASPAWQYYHLHGAGDISNSSGASIPRKLAEWQLHRAGADTGSRSGSPANHHKWRECTLSGEALFDRYRILSHVRVALIPLRFRYEKR
jgi:hypothetical protein